MVRGRKKKANKSDNNEDSQQSYQQDSASQQQSHQNPQPHQGSGSQQQAQQQSQQKSRKQQSHQELRQQSQQQQQQQPRKQQPQQQSQPQQQQQQQSRQQQSRQQLQHQQSQQQPRKQQPQQQSQPQQQQQQQSRQQQSRQQLQHQQSQQQQPQQQQTEHQLQPQQEKSQNKRNKSRKFKHEVTCTEEGLQEEFSFLQEDDSDLELCKSQSKQSSSEHITKSQQQQLPPQQQSPPQQQAWSQKQQQLPSQPQLPPQQQQVPPQQQQAWSQKQQQLPSQPQLPPQQQQVPPPQQQQVPPPQQQAWSKKQQQLPPQQQQVPPPQQQAWSKKQQQLPPQQQQVPPQQQQAWSQKQQQLPSQPQLPPQQQQVPPPQQQAWSKKQQQLPPQQQQVPPQQQQAWSQKQQQLPSQPQLPPQQQQVPPPQQQAWSKKQQQLPPQPQQALPDQQRAKSQTQQQVLAHKQPKVVQQQSKAPDIKHITQEISKLPSHVQRASSQSQNILANIPRRKNPLKAGTRGRPIEVLTNMMQIKFGSKFQHLAIHYDVDIVPNLPKYLLRPAFKAAKSILFPNRNPAFDGKKNAFSAGRLPIADPESITVKVHNEDGREKEFRITFKIANEIDLSWLRHVKPGIEKDDNHQLGLQVLDVILRDAPSNNTITIARSFFSPPKGQVLSLGGGLDLWTGLFQSAVLGWKPYLNVDVSYKGFPKSQNVIDLLKTICSEEGGGRGRQGPNVNDPNELLNLIQYNMDNIKKFLKNIKVTVEIPGQATSRRTQRINDLVKCPRDNMFVCNGSKISVEQYYKSEKKYVIKYPFLPCLWVGPRDKNIHVPPEICTIVSGQTVQKPLNPNQTASMVRYAATSTTVRKQKILEAFQSVDYKRNPCMNEFDISINGEFEKVPARVLDPPQLSYQNGICRVAKGIWRPNKFLKPSSLICSDGSWTILNLTRFPDDRQLYELNNSLVQTGKNVGMQIGKPVTPFRNIQLRGSDIRELSAYFNEQKKKGLKLIIVIVSETKGLYGKVKQITELNVGVLTQCLKSKTLMKLSDATLTNILLKINAKLNGINHTFETKMSRPKCLNTPCMIVGADVTHPSPDAINIPSIAAITASHDPNAFMYNVEIRLQPPRQEIISSLTEVIIIQLKYFLQKTGHQPQKIIYYRDGVSEGQFHEIMNEELMAIRRACEKLNQSYKPHITFLVVQKRHHIRLFPLQPQFSDDAHKNFNVQAGTIVDTAITHPSHIDFYLVSHASIQGTARPTKYRCLWDDSDMSEDEIENLTYFLCHMFSRCTRSVSYPTPTYYAHLAAFRARALTEDVPISLQHLQQEQLKKLTINSEILKGMPMFFV